MKKLLVILIVSGLFYSCNNSSNIPPPPTEKCENISLSNIPIITHGFSVTEFDSVLIRSYIKNSNFDTIINEFRLKLNVISDEERQQRDIDLPENLRTGCDWEIIFNDTLKFKITEMKTEWEPRWCQSFCGYECTLTSYKLNGKIIEDGSNIFIQEPNFVYPWEKK